MKRIQQLNPFKSGWPVGLWYGIAIWFSIWALVGFYMVARNLQIGSNGWADLVFLALASALIFLETGSRRGWLRAWLSFAWVILFSGCMESLGVLTGWPFGDYEYTSAFGVRIAGVLPLGVPLAWWVVIQPLFRISRERSAMGPFSNMVLIPLFVAGTAVWVDLLLEPVAWLMRGYWIWEGAGLYYGVPMQNFAGWFITAWILASGLLFLDRGMTNAGPAPSGLGGDLLVLLVVVATFTLAAFTGGYWPAGLIGLCLIGYLGGSALFFEPPSPSGESQRKSKKNTG